MKFMGSAMSSYCRNHRVLFDAFRSARELPAGEAHALLRQRLKEVRDEYARSRCAATRIAYQRYLDYFSRRFGSKELTEELMLSDAPSSGAGAGSDPAGPERMIAMALSHKAEGRPELARTLLQRVAASGFREAESARRLLADMLDESLT